MVGASCSGIFGCGYSPALSGQSGGLDTQGKASLVPEPLVLRAALRGARERLAELGAFEVGSRGVLSIEVLRLDELGAAARASDGLPLGRAEEIVVRARGEVRERGELVFERDLSRRALVAAGAGLELDRDGALFRAGHAVGRALASAALGLATPSA